MLLRVWPVHQPMGCTGTSKIRTSIDVCWCKVTWDWVKATWQQEMSNAKKTPYESWGPLFFLWCIIYLGYMDGQWESNDLEAFVFEMLKLEVVKKDRAELLRVVVSWPPRAFFQKQDLGLLGLPLLSSAIVGSVSWLLFPTNLSASGVWQTGCSTSCAFQLWFWATHGFPLVNM